MKNILIKILYRIVRGAGARKETVPGSRRRFLVVSATGVGDTLWGTPALAELRVAFPEGHIGVLTSPPGSEILKGNPAVDELFVFRRGTAGFLSMLSLLRTLRKRAFDTVFVFHASDRIIWPLTLLTGAAEIIGVEGQNKGLDFILTRPVRPDPTLHAVETRFAQLRCTGATPSPRPLFLALAEREREAADAFLKNHGINGDSLLVGLHPGAQKPYKCWPPRHFITAGNLLAERLGCRVVVTGGGAERELADTVAAGIRGAISAAGSLSLRETAALIGKMDVFIANDTGPMHIAFALATPVVALFCPTDPRLCGPYRAEKAVVIEKAKTCTPCTGKKCSHPVCMDQISPGEVVTAAARLVRARDTAGV
ncbi:MAG: glycosyltransferase family 9 protein [Alphaproteobacteria bacterium]|uniref:Glycosyltransferase family 9 protein n=1 Tax=Candidatus Nitrobium versatile TaxID=2884831 RepID=A0A953JG30_9BACT|nr:glycosyltransferase family 9 protein [Candidatus Nitrobium versatile]